MNHHTLADDGDVHESARIQVDFLSHKWQEADVWHTWKNMTRHKNELANGVRLENASWRTWWQKRGKLKTVNPQKLNWLKDSDVTWLYGPLHEAPTVPEKPPKGASLQDKLNIIPPLPKGRKPILKKRTLAEVLVLGLAKTNNLPITPTRAHPDDLKELDIDSRGTRGPEERDRIMLLHTKSDTNLLRPSMGRVHEPSPPSDDEAPTPRRPSIRIARSHMSNSNNTSVSPPPEEGDRAKKRVGFNTYVAQCIAIAPGERDVSEEDEEDDDDALSMKSAGSGGVRHRRLSLSSRSNSHSSARSEPLIIARMAPTLLRGMQGDEENTELVYQPIETPFDGKDSDDESDFGEPSVPVIKIPKASVADDEGNGAADLGGDYNVSSKKRKLSAGETSPSNRPRKSLDNDSSSTLLLNPNGIVNTTPSASNPPVTVALARELSSSSTSSSEDSRGRSLHRTSSGSSLNERSRSRNGNSPMGSRSPDSSRASSSSNLRPSEIGATSKLEAVVENGESAKSKVTEEPAVIDIEPADAQTSPKQDLATTGFVDKAAATARGFIGTLLNGASPTGTKRGSL